MTEGTAKTVVVLTVGHSTRSLEGFIGLLQAHGVAHVADVRTVPRSRYNPQFNRETLPEALSAVGIGYVHFAGLGGLRHPRRDSPNTGWRTPGFRGYADYMQQPEFESCLESLIEFAGCGRVAVMCAEAVPWRCHRSLISDALVVRGIPVEHILTAKRLQPHSVTRWACVRGTRITYPAETAPLKFESDKKKR